MLQTAVIGLGELGLAHAAALRSDPLSRLVGVCDPDRARAARAGRRLGVRPYCRVGDLLRSTRPELVSICSEGAAAPCQVRAALLAGAHVLTEPPLAPTLRQSQGLAELARRRGRVLAADFNQRFPPAACLAAQWIAQGRLGTPLFANLSLWEEAPAGADPYRHLRTRLVHAVDLLRHWCGEVAAVQCFAASPQAGGAWAAVNLSLRLRSGLVAHINGSAAMTARHPLQRCEVAGNEARLELTNIYEDLVLYPHAEAEKTVVSNNIWTGLLGYEQTFGVRLHRLLEQLEAGTPPDQVEGGAADALAAQRVVEAAVRALEKGTVVKV